ncbi:hypothetical protein Cgig2_006837 [Carnegiea gigantea]|uniref:Uncharacterized protein n=1 Tax=Carnegiea gigantea TaxID=171969 RepID=A0A9Q1GG04_9CARY|nr:hypothetical protein Cgig2_006837 [Carnegiea gigantea]
MTDAVTRQVSEQVKRAMEAANLARLLPHFDYIPTHGGEPSHRPERIPSPRYIEQDGRPYAKQLGRRVAAGPSGRPTQGVTAKSTTASTHYTTHSRRTAYGHTMTECQELKKALHELTDKGQIDGFLMRGLRFLGQEQELAQPQPRDEECLTGVMTTVAEGYAEGINRSACKAQLRSVQQVLIAE